MKTFKATFIFLSIILSSCIVNTTKGTRYELPSVRNNVCKTLTNKVVLYAIFVDSKETHPWSKYDLESTSDSIRKSISWLEKMAKQNNIPLAITYDHPVINKKIPVRGELKYKTLSGTLFYSRNMKVGIDLIDDWSDAIARRLNKMFPADSSAMISMKNTMNSRERLIAKLRDIHKTDNIALMYFVNNYFEDEISFALHTSSDKKTEYAVVSTKHPSVIAHEFLHIFGALDLYISPFDRRKNKKIKKKAMKLYSNEIMAFAHRSIDSLQISSFTKYLIGWDNKLNETDSKIFIPRKRRHLTSY
ncbi:MAG: hypothetical protein R3279_04530 [Putridiphycobacter sp.]|nr:hypothetical protein [Putridiphycobacter sp.]